MLSSAPREIWLWTRKKVASRYVQKKWLRATVVVIVMMTLMVVPVTSRAIGQADIFAAALAVALPPFLPISAQIYVMFSLMIWLLVSWGWICAATAAAWAARSPSLLARQMQLAQASYVPGIPIAAQAAELTISGHFLDPRSSTVFGVFIFFGSLFFALGLGYRPEMAFVLYFALTFMDAILTFNPLIPRPSYYSAHTFVVAAAVYVAISIASQIIIFPESYNHSWLQQVREDVLLPIIEFMDHEEVAASKKPSPRPLSCLDPTLAMYEQMKHLFHLEFSVHRLSPDELVSLHARIKQLVRRVKNIEVSQNRIEEALQVESGASNENATDRDIVYRVSHLSDGLRTACRISLLDFEEWVRECTMDSWFDVINAVDTKKVNYRRLRLDISRSNLRKAQAKFKRDDLPNFFASTTQTSDILQSTDSHISLVERNKKGAVLPMALMDDIDLLATELTSLLSFLVDIEEKQPKPKPRLPCLFKSLPHESVRTKVSQPTISPPSHEEKGISSPTSTVGKRFRDVAAARSDLTSVSGRHSRLLQWILAPETIFAIRVAVLSVAFFAVNVSETTVKTYMNNSGVIALLLGQSYVAIYAGDQVFFFVVRFTATVIGLLLTLAAWFIGAGRGSGNVYTTVILTSVFVIPSLLISVCSTKMSHALFAALASTTVVATTGIIWSQTHGPGGGVPSEIVFTNIWQRLLMDLIGFTASAIIMMIPVPITARSGFHGKLSKSLLQVSGMMYNGMDDSPSPSSERDDVLRSVMKKQNMLMHFLTSMNFDPRIRSYPSATYRRIVELQARLVLSTMQYMESLERLDTALRHDLARRLPSLNSDKIDQVQSHMVDLARKIAAGSRSPKLVNLEEELRQSASETFAEYEKLGLADVRCRGLLALPVDVSEAQLLILSSIVVNFASIVNSMDEMNLLFEGMERERKPEEGDIARYFRSQNA